METQQKQEKPRAVTVKLSEDAMKRVVGGADISAVAQLGAATSLQIVSAPAIAGRMFLVL